MIEVTGLKKKSLLKRTDTERHSMKSFKREVKGQKYQGERMMIEI